MGIKKMATVRMELCPWNWPIAARAGMREVHLFVIGACFRGSCVIDADNFGNSYTLRFFLLRDWNGRKRIKSLFIIDLGLFWVPVSAEFNIISNG
jgi:hypothetical protein